MAKLDSINLCKLYDDFPASTLLPAAAVLRYFSICYGILCLITRLGKKEEGWAVREERGGLGSKGPNCFVVPQILF
jgi:hypothetical protein